VIKKSQVTKENPHCVHTKTMVQKCAFNTNRLKEERQVRTT